MDKLTIGKLSEKTGVSADTLRYYEKLYLLKPEVRTKAGYRVYSPDAINIVRFIRGAKALNFTLEEIRTLLELNSSDQASCAAVLKKTEAKIKEAEQQIRELRTIRKVLTSLAAACPGGDAAVESCPIMDHIQGKASKKARK
jgi:DNA-binding transcriptional MerR regulator